MKRTDLEKLKGVAIESRMKQAGVPGRYGKQSAQVLSRRERRDADQAQGLVPFALKLNSELIASIRALHETRGGDLNALVSELLEAGLAKVNK